MHLPPFPFIFRQCSSKTKTKRSKRSREATDETYHPKENKKVKAGSGRENKDSRAKCLTLKFEVRNK